MHKRMHGGLLRSRNMSRDRADFFVVSELAAKDIIILPIIKSEYARHAQDAMV